MHALMRYTVKPDHLQTHLDLLHDLYRELATTEPNGLACTAYQVTGTRTFVELVQGENLPEPLPQLETFQRYRVGLDERCEGEREFLEIEPVGSFARVTTET